MLAVRRVCVCVYLFCEGVHSAAPGYYGWPHVIDVCVCVCVCSVKVSTLLRLATMDDHMSLTCVCVYVLWRCPLCCAWPLWMTTCSCWVTCYAAQQALPAGQSAMSSLCLQFTPALAGRVSCLTILWPCWQWSCNLSG